MKINLLFFIVFFTFTVNAFAQKPEIISVNKSSGTLGEMVTLSGNGFSESPSNNIVYFGAAKGKIISSSNSTIEVLVPAGATFDQISVTNLSSNLTGYSDGKFLLSLHNEGLIDESRLVEKIELQEEGGLFDFCVCDFNNDNLNDIVTTNNQDPSFSITAFINSTPENELGIKFTRFNDQNFLIGEETRNISCGDLDGDGKKDLVVGKGGNIADRLYLFRNISSNNVVKFSPFTSLSINIGSTQSSSRRIKIHDLDNDGKPEIIMTDQRNTYVHVYKNNSIPGEFRFSRNDRLLLESEKVTLGLDIADINKDGKPDVIFGSNLNANIYVAVNKSNNGKLIFDQPVKLSVSGQMVNIATGDFDLDGDIDIVVANFVNNVYILLNESTTDQVKFSSPKLYETGRFPFGIDVGDINGDGKPDIVAATNEASEPITILENRSTPGYLSLYQKYTGQSEIHRNIKIADFSGDGKPDIGFTIDGVNKVGIIRNQHCVTAEVSPEVPGKICAGRPSELTATKAQKVNYTWTNTTSGNSYTGDGYSFDASIPGNYTVTIYSQGDGCESTSDAVNVEMGGSTLPPTPTIDAPEAVCEGGTMTLSTSLIDGISYKWTTPKGEEYTGSTVTINNVQAENSGRYGLVLEGDGCLTDPVSAYVDISIVPDLEITATQDGYFCDGTQNILSVADLRNGTYEWYKNGQQISGNNLNQLAVSEEGEYKVKFTNQYNCSNATANFAVEKVEAPSASFSVNENVCLGETITVDNTSTFSEIVTPQYIWELNGEVISRDFEPSYTFNTKGSYTLTLTVNYGNEYCFDSQETQINVSEASGINILVNNTPAQSDNISICTGESVILSVDGTVSDISWSTGSTADSIIVSSEGTYTVTAAAEGNTCSSSDQITVSTVPGIELNILTESTRIKKGESIQIELEAYGAHDFLWDNGETLDDSTAQSPVASPFISTTYTVVASGDNNCTAEASVKIVVEGDRTLEVLAQPVITPNNDGFNDEWVIENINSFSSCSIVIMNRYGQTVFEASSYNNDWNGTINGAELPEETYYYVIKCSANEVHTGSITIMR